MTSCREVELKLELSAGGGRALRSHPLVEKRKNQQKLQKTVYYDTPKGKLKKAGFSLRVRTADGRRTQTIKQSAIGSAGLFDRPEWERTIERPGLDFSFIDETPLGAILEPKARRKLAPVVSSDVSRTIWLLSRPHAKLELSLDEGTISGGDREQRIDELEIELKEGEPSEILNLAGELGRSFELRLGVLSKAERGYALLDDSLGRVSKAEAIFIEPSTKVSDAFAEIAHSCLRHFRLNEPIIAQRDELALHQARVAIRRFRSALSLFRPAVEDNNFERIREELRWIANQLGDARNLDVLLERLRQGSSDGRTDQVQTARSIAYDKVEEALRSSRLRTLMLDIVAWVEFGEWRQTDIANEPILTFAADRVDRIWRKIRKAGRDLPTMREEPRHRVRIEIKKLRYTLEFFSQLFVSKRQKAFSKAMATIQEELGYLNDIATAQQLMTDLSDDEEISAPAATEKQERKHVARAQRAYGALVEAGPYWRRAVRSREG